jgi:hypothetical protein
VTITGSGANATALEFFFNGIAVAPFSQPKASLKIDRLAASVFHS